MAIKAGTPFPYAETKPSISGSAVLGQVLTCNDGVWLCQPVTITRQWMRDANTVIAGATNPTYTLIAADQTHTIKCRVTGTNGYGAVSVDTPSTAIVA